MRPLMFAFSIFLLSGCGAETATTAATGAAIKKQELEEGQKRQDEAKQKIERAMQQVQQRPEKEGER